MEVSELETWTLKDLRDFRARIDVAIRSAIARSRPGGAAKAEASSPIDVEREQESWEARMKADAAAFRSAGSTIRSS